MTLSGPAGPVVPVRTTEHVHPLVVRVTHALNAVAIVLMATSGWRIYDASPLFALRFPAEATLGGWLGGAIAWHLGAMWLLVVNATVYIGYGLISGHFRRRFLPVSPGAVLRDLALALTLRLPHRPGHYNAVQRLLYWFVLLCGVAAVASGLAIWKPVQLQDLAALLGGYETARRVHFFAMTGIVSFLLIHLTLVAVVPRTVPAMITGRARLPRGDA
ncbi:MAG: cytochrome b/b6 domain-containing protein [Azospirillaceae bacterium]|nr:cytochrome b/b6 domain-containing protein [Azospirillaceae bacterium]